MAEERIRKEELRKYDYIEKKDKGIVESMQDKKEYPPKEKKD